MAYAKEYTMTLKRCKRASEKKQCPSCHRYKCFVPYIWTATGQEVGMNLGRCDHEIKCGYHLKPSDISQEDWEKLKDDPNYIASDKGKFVKREVEKLPIGTIDDYYLKKSQITKIEDGKKRIVSTPLTDYLLTVPGITFDKLFKALTMYLVGYTKARDIVWWQVDEFMRNRTGKVMTYMADGHRFRPPQNADGKSTDKVTWVHSLLDHKGVLKADYHMEQCLFGEHLLALTPQTTPVCLVESEKSALICSIFRQDMVWMATGGKNSLKREKLEAIIKQRRKVYAFPDYDAMDEWKIRVKEIQYPKLVISDFVRKNWKEVDGEKADIADILLRRQFEQPPDIAEMVEEEMGLKEPHEGLRMLIKELEINKFKRL